MNRTLLRLFRNSLCLLLLLGWARAQVAQSAEMEIGVLELMSNGHQVPISPDKATKLSTHPGAVLFVYGPTKFDAPGLTPTRIRFKLEGYDRDWRESSTDPKTPNQMRMYVSFLDERLNEVKKLEFPVIGQSPGWTGSLDASTLHPRSESIVVPPGAETFWITISSAGGPEALGVFVVSDLVVRSPGATNNALKELLSWSLDDGRAPGDLNKVPEGWMRDGVRPDMARIVEIGSGLQKKALAIVDDDPWGHAQWNTIKNAGPAVRPGEQLVIEWDEMFSIGPATPASATYQDLPPGFYRFTINKLTLLGEPTNVEYALEVHVPLSLWKTPWFWATMVMVIVGLFLGSWRYRALQHLRAENLRLEQQQALERERFRIARDIHDDLGARVTQISLASAMAERTASDAVSSAVNFQSITRMAREMVASLYDTIWVVNPENDNLEAVGHYLCQTVNQLSSQAGLRCRLEVPSLPSDVPISSHQRHNLNMAVKEALHNVIKHAAASEVRMRISVNDSELTASLCDDGKGFDLKSCNPGNGLTNMRHRLEDIGGCTTVESVVGRGTAVTFIMPIRRRIVLSPGKDRKPVSPGSEAGPATAPNRSEMAP